MCYRRRMLARAAFKLLNVLPTPRRIGTTYCDFYMWLLAHGGIHAIKGRPQTVLYVPSLLANNHAGAMPHMPPMMAFDWQARLLSQLNQMGLEVTLKPHPGSSVELPAAFSSDFGATVRHERFESIMEKYDILLFDYPTQTCFGSALRSSKAMVLIDFGIATYGPDLRALLEKRCAVVPGHFDDQNRAQTNENDLRDAIYRAPALQDRSFANAVIAL